VISQLFGLATQVGQVFRWKRLGRAKAVLAVRKKNEMEAFMVLLLGLYWCLLKI
jgi:hypothetical protein